MLLRNSIFFVLLVGMLTSVNAHAEVVASRLIAFDSFVRIPFPANVDVENVEENTAASRQKLRLSRALRPQERADVENTLRDSGHLRGMYWADDRELVLEFSSMRASAVEITQDLWAAVVKREGVFPISELVGLDVCRGLFPNLKHPELVKQRDSLCAGSRTWVAKPGIYETLTRSQEYVADVMRMFTGPQPPDVQRIQAWAERAEDARPEDQASVELIYAIMLIQRGDDLAGIVALSHLAANPSGKTMHDTARMLATATFEREVENLVAQNSREASLEFWKRFQRWDSPDVGHTVKQTLALWFRKKGDFASALQQYQDLLGRGFDKDIQVLEPLAQTYLESGQAYRAYATRQFIQELGGKD